MGLNYLTPLFGTMEAGGHLANFYGQVERRFHTGESNCQPYSFGLDTSPLSVNSLGSSHTWLPNFENTCQMMLAPYFQNNWVKGHLLEAPSTRLPSKQQGSSFDKVRENYCIWVYLHFVHIKALKQSTIRRLLIFGWFDIWIGFKYRKLI